MIAALRKRFWPQPTPTTTGDLANGDSISLQFSPSSSSPPSPVEISAKIQEAFRPFTMSPVFRVSFSGLSPPGPSEAILKFYDRRCLTGERIYHERKPWSATREKKYQAYLAATKAGSRPATDFESPDFDLHDASIGEFEAYLAVLCQELFATEQAIYERLSPLQGTEVPVLHGMVHYSDGQEVIPGILIEYIPSTTLRQAVETWSSRNPPLPNTILVNLCRMAINVVDHISDFDVLNEDVRVDNIIVREPCVDEGLRVRPDTVVVIDLASSTVRKPDESDETWVCAKWSADEAGAVAWNVNSLIKEHVGPDIWTHEHIRRWRCTLPPYREPGEEGFSLPTKHVPLALL